MNQLSATVPCLCPRREPLQPCCHPEAQPLSDAGRCASASQSLQKRQGWVRAEDISNDQNEGRLVPHKAIALSVCLIDSSPEGYLLPTPLKAFCGAWLKQHHQEACTVLKRCWCRKSSAGEDWRLSARRKLPCCCGLRIRRQQSCKSLAAQIPTATCYRFQKGYPHGKPDLLIGRT